MVKRPNKKVLIITYYWPPAGGPGVQRVLKFVKYLPSFGWDPIVLTVENGEYPAIDLELEKDIPAEIKVYKTKTWEPFSIFKKINNKKQSEKLDTFILQEKNTGFFKNFSRWVRSNIFIPDARIGWYFFASKKANQICKEHGINLIFSSSPPHSLQLIAKKTAGQNDIPWVTDFRDPWNGAFWESSIKKSYLAKYLNNYFENSVIKKADKVTTVSMGVKEILGKDKYPDKIELIYNGYDKQDFLNLKKEKSKTIKIRYLGNISASQSPENLVSSFSKLSEEQWTKLDFSFYGSFDASFRILIDKYNLENKISVKGYISHNDTVKEMINADILILLIPNIASKGILTGKLFEYIAAKSYILAISPENPELKQILTDNGIGDVYTYDQNLDQIISTLIESKKYILDNKGKNTDIYERHTQTEKLANLFTSLCP